MFDEEQSQGTTPKTPETVAKPEVPVITPKKSNVPKQEVPISPTPPPVEDIFADTDNANMVPGAPAAAVGTEQVDPILGSSRSGSSGSSRKVIVVILVTLVIVLIALAVMIGLSKLRGGDSMNFFSGSDSMMEAEPEAKPEAEPEAKPEAEPEAKPEAEPEANPVPEPVVRPNDNDQDGLTNIQEEQVGTDINLADTDNDGLTDADEVFVYGTNPLNPDTDGDTYPDGAEVENGYNPNGEGQLVEQP